MHPDTVVLVKDMLLKLTDVGKKYKLAGEKKPVLNGLNLEIDSGEIVSITGKSGCGKTTILNIIAGIVTPDSGRVYLNERKINYYFDFLASRRRNREMGFIFQMFKLLPDESILSNVLLPARIRGYIGTETRDYVNEILGKLRIYKLRKSRAGLLSGGEKQRVAIARALVNRPSIILADEPTANLDKLTSTGIFNILVDLKEEGKAILIITHKDYMHERSDFVYNMEDGKLKALK